jgi:hypothetical protein
MNIGAGGTLDVGDQPLFITGGTFINNGNLIVNAGNRSRLAFTGQNTVYSGSGVTGPVRQLEAHGNSLTLDPASNVRVSRLLLYSGDIVNASRLTIGNNDATRSLIGFGDPQSPTVAGTLDSAPVFELGTGGLDVYYSSADPRVTGPEIPSDRTLINLSVSRGSVAITGGDIAVITKLTLSGGEIVTGPHALLYYGAPDQEGSYPGFGFVNGNLVRSISSAGQYFYPVGVGFRSPVIVNVTVLGSTPSLLGVRPIDETLQGLYLPTAVSRHWILEETGDITANLIFRYLSSDVNGNASNYKLWRDTGGQSPDLVPGSIPEPAGDYVSVNGITDFNGAWGIGENVAQIVSISGSVLTSTGVGIRNALVTISGGNLPQPVTFQTGQFGLYVFEGLRSGETYNVHVSAKRFRFGITNQPVTPTGDVTNVNFVANPQEEF